MKEEKVGLTATNWILSIVGIILLMSIIILPPVFRSVFKEEIIEDPPQPEIVLGTTTCNNPNLVTQKYTDNETLIFTYKNQKIQEFKRQTTRTYVDTLVYQEEKLIYGKYVTAFSIISGYQYSATPNDDISVISIQENYDLTQFRPTTVTLADNENPIAVTTPYQLDDDISTLIQYLTTNGYTCS